MKVYILFGTAHNYVVNGKVLNSNHTAIINAESENEGRKIAFKLFNGIFSHSKTEYDGAQWDDVPVELTAEDIAIGYKDRFSVMKTAMDMSGITFNDAVNDMIEKQRVFMINAEMYINTLEKEIIEINDNT